MDNLNKHQFQASLKANNGFEETIMRPIEIDLLLDPEIEPKINLRAPRIKYHRKDIPMNKYARYVKTEKAQDQNVYEYKPGDHIPMDLYGNYGYTIPKIEEPEGPKGEPPVV